MSEFVETYHAPAKRRDIREIAYNMFKSHFEEILSVLPDYAMILTEQRQIVFINEALTQMLALKNPDEAFGARPGEIFKCIHSNDHINGCGTSRDCRFCGAVNVVLKALDKNQSVSGEARITSNFDGVLVSFDLNVKAIPIEFENNRFIMVFISDISAQKRKQVLERIFIHDMGNVLTPLTGLLTIFPLDNLNQMQREQFRIMNKSALKLVDLFRSQKVLLNSELGDIELNITKNNSSEIIESTKELISSNIKIITAQNSESIMFNTDTGLLVQILLNLLKNAVEASTKDSVVHIGCKISDQNIIFFVKNQGVMREVVKSQIFQRSFSTKGIGRGIGTYSAKLFTERYLRGKVYFESSQENGTIFYVELPLKNEI